jgi:hypothetical protein
VEDVIDLQETATFDILNDCLLIITCLSLLSSEQKDEGKVFFFHPLEERKIPSAIADAKSDDQGTEAG